MFVADLIIRIIVIHVNARIKNAFEFFLEILTTNGVLLKKKKLLKWFMSRKHTEMANTAQKSYKVIISGKQKNLKL